jgi:general secretion pathway protein F
VSRFAFEAIDRLGANVRGTLDARNQAAVLDQLIASGHTPISIRPLRAANGMERLTSRILGSRGFDYVRFLQELAILLKAGLTIERALSALKTLTLDAKSTLRIRQIVDRVRGGEPLSQVFAVLVPEAPPHISHLLAAGESSGQLPEIADRIAKGLVKMRALRTRIFADLAYPALLIVAIVIVLWVIFNTVLPRLMPLFEQSGVTMPFTTELLIDLKAFFDSYGWFFLIALIVLTGAGVRLLNVPRFRRAADRKLLVSRVFFGLPRTFEAALFCRNLQIMLEGGLTLDRAMAAVKSGVRNRWLQQELAAVQIAVRDGTRLSKAITSLAPTLPPVVAEFTAVGEETGRLAAVMREAADLLDHRAQTRLDQLTALVSPVATLIMGSIVALLMSGIVGGILAINDIARS